MSLTVGALESVLEDRFPLVRAEPWDRNGLLVGDRNRKISGVRIALDPTVEVIGRAADAGENVVLTHHPAALRMPDSVRAGAGESGVLFAALDAGVALLNAHTNLDRDPDAQRRLPQLLELVAEEPLEASLMPMALATVFVPPERADVVAAAMSEAGAGRIGDYTGCSFAADGTGRFTVPPDGAPALGTPGAAESVAESRVEMVCPRGAAAAVVEAARRAHPYEEPLIVVTEMEMARNAVCLGMVSRPSRAETLGSLVERAAHVFGIRPRVWGDADLKLTRVATSTGSAGSLIPDALSRGANVLLAGEVRYHDAMNSRGLAIIEIGHDVSEWPLVELLADAVRSIPGMSATHVTVEPASYGWWTP